MGKITKRSFGSPQAFAYQLRNQAGLELTVSNFGARLVSLVVPLADGQRRNIVLTYASDQDYLANDAYVGAIIGPVAGRIAGGSALIRGQEYHFTQNEAGNTLHGGEGGYHLLYWDSQVDESSNCLSFELTVGDGYNGFPGPVSVRVSYQLTEENEVIISYQAQSDKDTLFNPTNHVYFNLAGNPEQTLAGHSLQIQSDSYLPLDKTNLPTGEFAKLAGTPFDFRQAGDFAQGFALDHQQTKLAQGFDHAWLLDKSADLAAAATSPDGRIKLNLETDASSLVIYTYNFKEEKTAGIAKYGAFSLETQEVPNACHIAGQEDKILLEKGQTFKSQSSFKVIF